jgi:hypothetical protein
MSRRGSNPAPGWFNGQGHGAGWPLTCDSRSPIKTARARREPVVPDAMRTEHGPAPLRHGWLRSSATRIGSVGRAQQGRSLPATYGVRGAFMSSWASDSANLATHSLQMKISVSLAKSWESLTGYSAPKMVCTC